MPFPSFIEKGYLRLVDAVFDRITRPLPATERLENCKIISHRGIHDNRSIAENTIPAFERAQKAGVWGIELDIRWTRDMEPVVFHDPDLLRMHGVDRTVSTFSFSELKKQFPTVPALSEVVNGFGKNCHLMIEVKTQPWLDAPKQVQRLYQVLNPLEPTQDYHLITFSPDLFAPMREIPKSARIIITDKWPALPSKWVRQRQWGGLCGHYLFMSKRFIESHHRYGQKVGTGYIQTRNTLYRELNRGIDWIFSNAADRIQRILNETIDMQK